MLEIVGAVLIVAVIDKSSTAKPLSLPETSLSAKRIKTNPLLAIFNPVILPFLFVKFPEAFPSLAPAVPDVTGEVKLRVAILVNPVAAPTNVAVVALGLYEKASKSFG